jgi:hypothetical protein
VQRSVVVLALLALPALSGCKDKPARADQAVRARAIASVAFPVPLSALADRYPGVVLTELKAGYGPLGVPPRVFVRVPSTAAKGDVAFPALMRRLGAAGWTLGSTGDSANGCTPEPQALPCLFGPPDGDGSIRIVPLAGGGYELTASPELADGP